jgi:hypothetical protein
MRRFASRVEILNQSGGHLRYAHAEFAAHLIAAGSAAIENANGKIKSVRLIATAATHAHRIGEPGEWKFGIRFVRLERLDESASRVWVFKRVDPPEPE